MRITSGSVFVPGLFQGGTIDISGTQGFSLTAIVDNAPNAFWTCSVPECVGGTPLDSFVNLGGPTGTALVGAYLGRQHRRRTDE